jgi:hypothetical protein
MAIIPAHHKKKYESSYEYDFYSRTIAELNKLELDGVWIYTWHGGGERVGAKNLWDSETIKLKENIRGLERAE